MEGIADIVVEDILDSEDVVAEEEEGSLDMHDTAAAVADIADMDVGVDSLDNLAEDNEGTEV